MARQTGSKSSLRPSFDASTGGAFFKSAEHGSLAIAAAGQMLPLLRTRRQVNLAAIAGQDPSYHSMNHEAGISDQRDNDAMTSSKWVMSRHRTWSIIQRKTEFHHACAQLQFHRTKSTAGTRSVSIADNTNRPLAHCWRCDCGRGYLHHGGSRRTTGVRIPMMFL
jgi:hypothetical protein